MGLTHKKLNTPLDHIEWLSHGEAIDTLNQFCSSTQMKGYAKRHLQSGTEDAASV